MYLRVVKPDPVSGLQVLEGSVTVNSATVTWKSPNKDYAMLFRVSLKSSADSSVRVRSSESLLCVFMTDGTFATLIRLLSSVTATVS